MDDGGAGEVLHAERVEPAAGVPDPMGDDGVDEGEYGSKDEVDPELRALGHRPPDDRERDAGEDDFEEVGAGSRDRREEGVGRLGDAEERVDARREAARAEEGVPVTEGESEADSPVNERAEAEDEDVLACDV